MFFFENMTSSCVFTNIIGYCVFEVIVGTFFWKMIIRYIMIWSELFCVDFFLLSWPINMMYWRVWNLSMKLMWNVTVIKIVKSLLFIIKNVHNNITRSCAFPTLVSSSESSVPLISVSSSEISECKGQFRRYSYIKNWCNFNSSKTIKFISN